MKISELRYNPEKPKRQQVKIEVPAGTAGAHEESAIVNGVYQKTGRWIKWVYQDKVDAAGKTVMGKTFSEPRFRPKTAYDPSGKRHGEITRAGKKGEGAIMGTVGDWLTLMGAGRDDIALARIEVLHSPEYQQLTGPLGFEDISTEGDKKNGTITLEGTLEGVIGSEKSAEKFRRKVLANGQLRAYSSYGGHVNTGHGWRPAALHPFTIENSPHMTPHERIVATMRQSLRQLVKHYGNTAKRHFVSSLKR